MLNFFMQLSVFKIEVLNHFFIFINIKGERYENKSQYHFSTSGFAAGIKS